MEEAIRLSRVVSLEDEGSIPPGPIATFVRCATDFGFIVIVFRPLI
jgi:hypothetical protein